MTLLHRIVIQLRDHGIACALVGAEALALRGVSRSTLDRDLLVTDPRVLDDTLWLSLRAAGATTEIRHGDEDDPLAGVVRFRSAGERPVDLIVGRHAWQTRLLGRSERLDLSGLEIAVPRAADLVLLKLYAGGAQDTWDVAQLLAGEDRAALIEEVEERLPELPDECRRLWERTLLR